MKTGFNFPTEEFLNHPDEVHALVNGFYVGVTALPGKANKACCEKEKHYWRAGFLLGWAVKAAVILYAGPRLLLA